MKKLLVLAFSCLMLCACSSGEIVSSSNGGNNGNNSSNGSEVSQNNGSSQVQSQSGNKHQLTSKVTLPEKVKFVTNMSALTINTESYKIGNKFMFKSRSDIIYAEFDENHGGFNTWCGSYEGGQVYWNPTVIPQANIYDVYDQVDQGFIVECEASNSYFNKYLTNKKTGESKEVAGHQCVKYFDDFSNFTYWVEESSMLIYEHSLGVEETSTKYQVLECSSTLLLSHTTLRVSNCFYDVYKDRSLLVLLFSLKLI